MKLSWRSKDEPMTHNWEKEKILGVAQKMPIGRVPSNNHFKNSYRQIASSSLKRRKKTREWGVKNLSRNLFSLHYQLSTIQHDTITHNYSGTEQIAMYVPPFLFFRTSNTFNINYFNCFLQILFLLSILWKKMAVRHRNNRNKRKPSMNKVDWLFSNIFTATRPQTWRLLRLSQL